MRIKKRFIFLISVTAFFGFSRCSIFAFRESDEKQSIYLKERGQKSPEFFDYKVGKGGIHFTHVGDKEKPLVLFVHGSPGSSSAYLDYLADTGLVKIAQLVAVDRPGFGFSNYGKVEVSVEKQAAYLKPILKKFRRDKAILVGHSFGGPVITRMAMDFPELVDGLVIVAGSVSADLEPREWWRPVINFPLFRWLIPPSLKVCNQEILPLWKELEKMEAHWDKINCPVTIVQGELDTLVPKGNAEFAKKMLVNSPKVEMKMIKGGNHFILWSLKNEIIEEIKKLLN